MPEIRRLSQIGAFGALMLRGGVGGGAGGTAPSRSSSPARAPGSSFLAQLRQQMFLSRCQVGVSQNSFPAQRLTRGVYFLCQTLVQPQFQAPAAGMKPHHAQMPPTSPARAEPEIKPVTSRTRLQRSTLRTPNPHKENISGEIDSRINTGGSAASGRPINPRSQEHLGRGVNPT